MNGIQQENTSYGGAAAAPQAAPAPRVMAETPLPTRRKSPALATTLSLLPGLGQVYVGYYQQGFINILVVSGLIAILNSIPGNGLEPFFGVFMSFFWIFNMIDANRRALHYNRVAAGLGGEEVPDSFSIPGTNGSLFGGIVLTVVGLLLFLNLKFDVSMVWLEDWWPLALIAGGLWLVVKARREKE